jgi:four helix bundle protein
MQLGRSATSAGANYEEACGAESRADFIHKMQLVLKESRESIYWLRLIKKADLISSSNLEKQIQEANELANIIAKSIVTAKSRK